MIASEQALVDHVAAHAGEGVDVASVVDDVLAAIDPALDDPARELVASELPPRLADVVRRAHGKRLVLRGARLEAAASVCRALAEELSVEAIDVLRGALPPPLAGWLVADADVAREHEVAPPPHDTLAEGRPGSHAPVDEARPAEAQPDSVAAPDPHEDRKLSTTTGAHDTLAEGRPRTRRDGR